MERFKNGQRVRVTTIEKTNGVSMAGKIGTVVRIRMQDPGAWIEFDETIPEPVASFEDGDSRRNHMIFYPYECEEVNERLK